jgi:hypothetical protein
MAFVLVFDSGVLSSVTKQLSDSAISYVASVGSSVLANVPENEINTLTAQISARERELDAREALLREREIDARDFGTTGTTDYSTYIIGSILFVIILLLMLNYIMDWKRVQRFNIYEKSTS